MNSKRFVSNLEKATGSKTKTKKIILGCYEDIVTDRILGKKYTLEQIGKDLKNFISWLHNEKGVDTTRIVSLLVKGTPVINNDTNVDVVRGVIDDIFDNNLEDSNDLRMEYNVMKLVYWLEKSQGVNVSNVRDSLEKYFDSNKDETLNEMFENINMIFSNNLPHDYDFYESVFENIESRRISIQAKQANTPKFKIVDKYGVISSPTVVQRRLVRRDIGISQSNPVGTRLGRIDRMVQGGLDSTLKRDYDNLESISVGLTNEDAVRSIKSVWKNNVYKYLQTNKLKPRTSNRNSLYVFTVFLVLDQPFDVVLESAESSLEIDKRSVSRNGYGISTISKMMGKGYLGNFKTKLGVYMNPGIDLSPVSDFLKNGGVPGVEIKEILSEITESGGMSNERKMLETVYRVLKGSNLRKHGIKITRSVISGIYN